jgi:hypothetical protein
VKEIDPEIDGDVPNLGTFAACRRPAHTVFLGSAPTFTAFNRGIEDRRVKPGCRRAAAERVRRDAARNSDRFLAEADERR